MSDYIQNRKSRFNYEIIEKYEAGMKLLGMEVKSVRAGKVNIDNAFVIIREGEGFLINSIIEPYQPKNTKESYVPARNRKLLMTKKEIRELANVEKNKNLTIIPLAMYNKGRKIKLSIAVVKGKKKFDKRENIKKREVDRNIRREYKR